jgi:tight adherence protein B
VTGLWAAALLVTGAIVVAWPGGRGRFGRAGRVRRDWRPLLVLAGREPRRAAAGAVAAAAGLGLLSGGPVAGFAAGAYAGLGSRALLRRAARRRAAGERRAALDALAGLAADLRAGLPPVALSTGSVDAGRLSRLIASVWRLAEQTGAPAADLVERIEADARSADRAAASATAQSAGAQATSTLLTALPIGGLLLGQVLGVDPVHVLLRTPIGAACAVVALALQSTGLIWADRLAYGAAR